MGGNDFQPSCTTFCTIGGRVYVGRLMTEKDGVNLTHGYSFLCRRGDVRISRITDSSLRRWKIRGENYVSMVY